MFERVLQLVSRFGEVEKLLGDPGILSDKAQYKELTQEHAYLTEVKEAWDLYQNIQKQLEENRELLKEVRDEELTQMLKEEIDKLEKQEVATKAKIETLLVPPDPNDHRNTILEVRAGTGGDE